MPRYVAGALKGFTGLAKGEAIERTHEECFPSLKVGELAIPLESIVYDMDREGIDYFGSLSTPDLPLGRLVRIAIALPLFIESVEVGDHLYVDGGIIEMLSARPIFDDGGFEHVFAVNFMLPPQLHPADITGWQETTMGVLKASRQAEQDFQLEFANRMRDALGGRLTVSMQPITASCEGRRSTTCSSTEAAGRRSSERDMRAPPSRLTECARGLGSEPGSSAQPD